MAMVTKPIVVLPNLVLRQRSRRVTAIDQEVKSIIEAMISSTAAWEAKRPHESGVAMAAIQIGEPYKIIIIRQNPSNRQKPQFSIFLNPKIIKTEGSPQLEPEGCLSITDIYGLVPRYPKVKIKAQDLEGREVRFSATGFLARIWQHEIDHLQGKLFIDRVPKNNFFKIDDSGELVPIAKNDKSLARILKAN